MVTRAPSGLGLLVNRAGRSAIQMHGDFVAMSGFNLSFDLVAGDCAADRANDDHDVLAATATDLIAKQATYHGAAI